MRAAAVCLVALAAFAGVASAHGGAYATPPSGSGTPAAPGFGGPTEGGPATRWETWWADDREDLLRIAERADAASPSVVTPGADGVAKIPDAARSRATRAAPVRGEILLALRVCLSDEDFDVRSSAAIALGKAGSLDAAALLSEAAVKDDRDEVRRSALYALGILGQVRDLPFLCARLADRKVPSEERGAAALAVGLVGGDDAGEFLALFAEKDATRPDASKSADAQLLGTVYAAIGMSGSPLGLATLRNAADDGAAAPSVRAQAVLGLARARDAASAERLRKLLDPSLDQQVRRAATVALGRIVTFDDAATTAALRTLVVTERDPAVRRLAIRGLAGVRTNETASFLRAQFREVQEAERPFFALALGVQRDGLAVPLLREALKGTNDESSRSAYCTALGLVGDPDAVATLEREIAPGPSPGTYRGHAALALAALESPGSADVIWKRLPQEGDARVWGDYAVALGLLGDARARPFLVKAMNDGDGNFEKCRAASCLGVLRSVEAVPDLLAVVRNRRVDGIVRALAVVALGQIVDVSVVPRLSRVSSGGGATFATPAIAEAMSIL